MKFKAKITLLVAYATNDIFFKIFLTIQESFENKKRRHVGFDALYNLIKIKYKKKVWLLGLLSSK